MPVEKYLPDQWDAKAKLAAVIQTAAMNQAERSEYCSRHGLYLEQLDAWIEAFELLDTEAVPVTKAVLTNECKKYKRLEKELLSQERSLAHVATKPVRSSVLRAEPCAAGATMLATLQQLGVVPSSSRPVVSNDNPWSGALFKTLKYTPAYPTRRFTDMAQARACEQRFVFCYNTEHRHSGIELVMNGIAHKAA